MKSTFALVAVVAVALGACKDDKKKHVPAEYTKSYLQECKDRGGTIARVTDWRELTCKINVPEVATVEIDKDEPFYETPPETVVVKPVEETSKVSYASDWDKEKVEAVDEKGVKLNPVQEKKVEAQLEKDEKKHGPDFKEIYAHAPNKKFKNLCDSKGGTFSKIHGGKWVCRYPAK